MVAVHAQGGSQSIPIVNCSAIPDADSLAAFSPLLRSAPFVLPDSAQVTYFHNVSPSDTLSSFWALGAGKHLHFITDVVRKSDSTIISSFDEGMILGYPMGVPSPMQVIPPVASHQFGVTGSPEVYLQMRWESSPNAQYQLRVEDINAQQDLRFYDSTYLGKRISDRRWALPITDVALPFPNPSHDWTFFDYRIHDPGAGQIEIYDLLGRLIVTPYSGNFPTGSYRQILDTRQMSPGVYQFVVRVDARVAVRGNVVVSR
jgi:hypothetical protein